MSKGVRRIPQRLASASVLASTLLTLGCDDVEDAEPETTVFRGGVVESVVEEETLISTVVVGDREVAALEIDLSTEHATFRGADGIPATLTGQQGFDPNVSAAAAYALWEVDDGRTLSATVPSNQAAPNYCDGFVCEDSGCIAGRVGTALCGTEMCRECGIPKRFEFSL